MKTRLALVTGGTRGIGAAIAKTFHAHHYNIAVTYGHDRQGAAQFEKNTGIKTFSWDVGDFDACGKGIADVIAHFGQVPEILVNNAGIIHDSMLHKMPEATWEQVITTNLKSCFNMCRHLLPPLRERQFGRIINISSINALAGQIGQTNYAASKAGILGFTKSLARENAEKGITVNAIAPGYIKTEMTEHVPDDIMQKIIAEIPVKRLGLPEDIARAVLFLAADEAGFITGETLSVNGGHYMG